MRVGAVILLNLFFKDFGFNIGSPVTLDTRTKNLLMGFALQYKGIKGSFVAPTP